MRRARAAVRYGLLGLPGVFLVVFLVCPLLLTFAISFWQRTGFTFTPALTFNSYRAFFSGVRLLVFDRSLLISLEATAISLLLAYPVAYFLAFHAVPKAVRICLSLFTVPFLINYIIRTFAWTYLLDRSGPVNRLLQWLGLVHHPVSWLLYSDFAVFIGLVSAYMPFMVFPLWLSLSGIDQRLIEASWMLGARPARTFFGVILPLSLPGIFAATIFGFVGSFGESAVPTILGGVGFQLMGNTITSAMDVLDYPLAAAMSSVVVIAMLGLLTAWFLSFDLRALLGKIMEWRR
ncbi:MAG: ABC transporter permease [Rhodospirillales bacterium]|nr:ABC transporter permease [Rhodospirillales bacterium]